MATKRKSKSTRKSNKATDYSDDTGTVIPCDLCSYRVVAYTRYEGWRQMYYHLRNQHNQIRAAQLASNAERSMWRNKARGR